jgi:hypothetical protein
MQEINVLVTFCSRTGVTERIALAAALGAVQARAKIRLRWLREDADDQAVDAVPGWRENRVRMAKEYIAPREIDVLWADAMVLAVSARDVISSPELKPHLASLAELQSGGKLNGKLMTVLPKDSALASMYATLAEFDLILVPPSSAAAEVEGARLLGRRLTEVARALKQAPGAN